MECCTRISTETILCQHDEILVWKGESQMETDDNVGLNLFKCTLEQNFQKIFLKLPRDY